MEGFQFTDYHSSHPGYYPYYNYYPHSYYPYPHESSGTTAVEYPSASSSPAADDKPESSTSSELSSQYGYNYEYPYYHCGYGSYMNYPSPCVNEDTSTMRQNQYSQYPHENNNLVTLTSARSQSPTQLPSQPPSQPPSHSSQPPSYPSHPSQPPSHLSQPPLPSTSASRSDIPVGLTVFSSVHPQCTVQLELVNKHIWKEFSSHSTEMIITKTGRRMFPYLSIRIRGLDVSKSYNVFVQLQLAEQNTLKFNCGKWEVNGQAEEYFPAGAKYGRFYLHPDSPNNGAHWMKQDVNFMKLKLTNNKDMSANDNLKMILVNSMHRYLPSVHIVEVDSEHVERFYSTAHIMGTDFIAVTAYQNTEITELKIKHNPFAKGFRDNSKFSESGMMMQVSIQSASYTHEPCTSRQQRRPAPYPLRSTRTVSSWNTSSNTSSDANKQEELRECAQ